MRKPLPSAAVLIAAFLLALTGCSADRGTDVSTGTAGTSPPARLDTAALDLLTASGTWPRTRRTLDRAVDVLTRRCMKEHGFPFPVGHFEHESPAGSMAIDLEERKTYGYGIVRGRTTAPHASGLDNYVASLPPSGQAAFQRSLFGSDRSRVNVDLPYGLKVSVHREGCDARSRAYLAGDVVTWARLTYVPQELDNHLASEVPRTATYRKAIRAWRSCMARHGYTYRSPEDAEHALRARYKAEGPSRALRQRETAVAVADGRCASAERLTETVLAARQRAAGALPAEYRRMLTDLSRRGAEAFVRATAVLRGNE